jgi:hypothetical protein
VGLAVVMAAGPVAEAGAGARASSLIRLGRAFHPGLSGFGQSRPRTIFLGGDPTGLVEKIHWSSWGGAEAQGSGDAEYVWPGTSVAGNRIAPGARIVAFQLGTCRGIRSYNALEWYFPRYGGTFDPHHYFDTCSGEFRGKPYPSSSCPDVTLADGAGRATFVIAVGLSCRRAADLIAELPLAEYLPAGGRFSQSGYRCGSEGATGGATPLFGCQSGSREIVFFVEPHAASAGSAVRP